MKIEVKQSKDLIPYPEALEFMEQYVDNIIAGQAISLIWFLEHPPLYTAGVSAKQEDLLSAELPVYQTARGGQYTYHGPGQRIVYLLMDLKALFYPEKPDVRKYVYLIEEWLIMAIGKLGITAERREGRIGIWVQKADNSEAKIASIGIKIRKWVSYHGVAINLDPNLSHFSGIIPCGIREYGVTSLAALGKQIDKLAFDKILLDCFSEQFRIEWP